MGFGIDVLEFCFMSDMVDGIHFEGGIDYFIVILLYLNDWFD